MTERFVPIDQANTEIVNFSLPLPSYLDRERIGVDVGKIDRLCKIGGIKHLSIVGELDGETSQFTPTVVGFNSKGEAYAAKIGVETKVPTYSIDSQEQPRGLFDVFSGYRKAEATLNINLNEIANRTVNGSKHGINARDPEKWTPHLDQSIKKGIAKIVAQNLILMGNRTIFYQVLTIGTATGLAQTLRYSEAFILPINLLFIHQVSNFIELIMGGRFGLRDYRWSLFAGLQLDRALVVKVMANKGNLVKTLPEPQNT